MLLRKYLKHRPAVELLEERTLLSGSLTLQQILTNEGFVGPSADTEATKAPYLLGPKTSASVPVGKSNVIVSKVNASVGNPQEFKGPAGYAPFQLQHAYGFDQLTLDGINTNYNNAGAGQTIAIIDVGDYANITSDLQFFDEYFNIGGASGDPSDTSFFTRVDQNGGTNYPGPATSDSVIETALDVEWAHAMAPSAKILLVEANSFSNAADVLQTAPITAASYPGVSVVSMSYGYGEFPGETGFDPSFTQVPGHIGVTFLAASGDGGAGDIYPSSSPNVLSAGGTTLNLNPDDTIANESGWSGSGGGPSVYETQPAFQSGVVNSTQRTAPDWSYDSDPNTGVSVYASAFGGFIQVGGTSAATPQLAATIAITNQYRAAQGLPTLNTPGSNQSATELYNLYKATPGDFHDIVTGNNGYPAGPGYDFVTGLGTPVANQLIPDLASINTGLTVASVTPAAKTFVTSPPTVFTVGFSDPIDPNSLQTAFQDGDFTVNGLTPSSYSLSSDDTSVTFTYDTSPVTAQGPQSLVFAGGDVLRQKDQSPLKTYSETFYYATTPLNVSSISPASGSVIVLPTDVLVHFNAAVDPASISTSNIKVSEGTVASAMLINPTTADYKLSGVEPDGSTLTVTMAPDTVEDAFDNPGPQTAFSATYQVNVPISAFPTLSQLGVPGGLVYSGSDIGNIGFTGDTHSYTLQLDAGQILSAYVTSDPSLQTIVQVDGPNGQSLGKATATGAGKLVALSGVTVGSAGTYTIVISGKGSTTGNFTLNVVLNSALQKERYLGGDIDGTLASAQALNFQGFVNGSSRSAMLGQIPLGTFAGDTFVSSRGVGVELVNGATGKVELTLNDPSFAGGTINDVELGVNGDIYVALDAATGGNDGSAGEIVHFTAGGTFVGIINLPNESSTGFQYYPFGFDVAADGSIWVAGPNSGSIIHASATGSLIASYSVGGQPEWTAVRPDGTVLYTDDSTSSIYSLNPSTGIASFVASDPAGAPLGITVIPSGGFLVADPNYGILKYDGSGNLIQGIQDFNEPIDAQVDSSGNILAAAAFGTLDKFDGSGNLIYSTAVGGTPIGLAVVGTDDPAPPLPQTVDYYSFTLTAGQVASVELTTLQGSGASLALVGASGVTLALGTTLDGSDQAVNSFVAPTAGTYYIQVSGNNIQYSLIVNKSAELDNYNNTSLASAQLLVPDTTGNATVAGYVSAPVASLYAINWQQTSQQIIETVDPQTGAFLSSFNSPPTTLTNPFGFNMATDGAYLYFNDGAEFGDNTIFKINPTTDAVVSSYQVTGAPPLFGLAYLNGFLYGTDGFSIYKINPSNGAVLSSFSPGLDGNVTGIAGDPSRGVLWGVSQFHTLFEINPTTQAVIASAPDGLTNFEQDIGYQNNEIFVSETNGSSSDIAVFDPTTFALKRDMPVAAAVLSGLGADGVTSQNSYYKVDATAGNKLTITTTTPYGDPQQPFQPNNTLTPTLYLYDASGNLIATNTGGASDGKNDQIKFTVPTTGVYYVSVQGANSSAGEYTLTLKGATGALPAFTVADTNPAAGAHVPPLASITVDFSDSILLTSLPTAKVTFGGKAATGYQIDNDHEVTWFVQSLPAGLNVPYKFVIPAGAITDIHGVALSAFSETIIVNTVPPKVVSTSILNGNVLKPGSITYKVTFNEPIDTTQFSSSSFDLHGVYRQTDYSATSFSFNTAGNVLTITSSNLPDDAYTITLFSSGIQDLTGYHLDGLGDGVPGSGNYVVSFDLNNSKVVFPSLSALAPLGSLIYQGSTTGVIAPVGEADAYTVKLAKNQTVTIDLTTDGNLQGSVALYDPSGNLIDSFSASGQGGEVLLQTESAVAGGTYSIVVSGRNSTEGLYTLQVTLNAALELADHGGGSDNTLATAQPIDGSFINLGGTAFRGGVLGENNTPSISAGDVFVSARGGSAVSLVHDGVVVSTFTDPSLQTGVIQDIKVGPNGDVYVGIDTSPGSGNGGEILNFTPFGTLVGTILLPNDSANGFYYPFGFDIAGDGSIWVAAPNSGSVFHTTAAGALIQSYAVGGLPEWVAVNPSTGKVFYSDDDSGNVDVLDPSTGATSVFTTSPGGLPFGLRFTPAGNLLVADPNVGAIEYDPNGNIVAEAFDFGAIESQVDPSGNILITNAEFDSLDEFDPTGTFFLNFTPINGAPIGLAVEGVDGTLPPPPAPSYYSFKLDAGQTATVVLTPVSGNGSLSEALFDSNGNLLVGGTDVDTNVGQTLSYTANSAGTYYVAVTGTGVEYSVVVTKNAAFDTEPNDTQAEAQDLPAGNTALGAIDTPTDADWYSFSATAGNKLTITVGDAGQSALSPSFAVYNSAGVLVASASTKLTYTVPAGATGVYSVVVTGASSTTGEYVLRIQGATGPVLGQTVQGTPPHLFDSALLSVGAATASQLLLPPTSEGAVHAPVVGNTTTVTASQSGSTGNTTVGGSVSPQGVSDTLFTQLGLANPAAVRRENTLSDFLSNWEETLGELAVTESMPKSVASSK
jgi:streptogramin lyase